MYEQLEKRLRSELSAELNQVTPSSQLRYQPARRVRRVARSQPAIRLANALALGLVLLIGILAGRVATTGSLAGALPMLRGLLQPADGTVRFPGWETEFAFDYPDSWRVLSSSNLRSEDDPIFAVLADLSLGTSAEATDRLYEMTGQDTYVELRVTRLSRPPYNTLAGIIYGLFNRNANRGQPILIPGLPSVEADVETALQRHGGKPIVSEQRWPIRGFRDSSIVLFEASDVLYESAATSAGPARDVVYFSGNRTRSNIVLTAFAAPGQGERLAQQVVDLLNSLHVVSADELQTSAISAESAYTFSYPADWQPAELTTLPNNSFTPTLSAFTVGGASTARDVPLTSGQAFISIIQQPYEQDAFDASTTRSRSLEELEFSQLLMDGVILEPTALSVDRFDAHWAIFRSESLPIITQDTIFEPGTALPRGEAVPLADAVVIVATDGSQIVTLNGLTAPGEGRQLVDVLIQVLISAEASSR